MIGFLLCMITGCSVYFTSIMLEVFGHSTPVWIMACCGLLGTIGFCGVSDIYKDMKKRIEKLEKEGDI